MFRTLFRICLPNPLDWRLKRIAKKQGFRVLLGWNRGLGDIPLGLFAIVHRIRTMIPNAEITFLTRENLKDGFSMLNNVKVLIAPNWQRGVSYSVRQTLAQLGVDSNAFDLIIERPNPTHWVRWQLGTLIPRLQWKADYDHLWRKFGLSENETYICVQPAIETGYGLWRSWPEERWRELFNLFEKIPNVKILLCGCRAAPCFSHSNVIDLRGKTSLFELLSILKNRVKAAVLPDSGILSMIYYVDAQFPLKVISLWADCQGVLKQGVFSPNQKLNHFPFIGEHRNLASIRALDVLQRIFPASPLQDCPEASSVECMKVEKIGAILLAGGQGSRLGCTGPKGLFVIRDKSLFQWICEKIPADIPIAVMTSPLNHAETVAFFQEHRFFGKEVYFFQQDLLPFCDAKRRPLGILAPDGNGSVFKSFVQSGLCQKFEERGIDLLSVVPIENLLADPADPIFLSYARATRADAVLKCIPRNLEDPPMGALVERAGRLEVVEYTELDPSATYRYSYTGMIALTMSFMKTMAEIELPLHWTWKKAANTFAWKRERFIFDALLYAEKAAALCYLKKHIYAPLKSQKDLDLILEMQN